MRAYHRVDPLMDERKSHYTPAQLGTFLKVMAVASRHPDQNGGAESPEYRHVMAFKEAIGA